MSRLRERYEDAVAAKPYGVARLAVCFGNYYRWQTVIRLATQEEQAIWEAITREAYGPLVRSFTGSLHDMDLYDRNGNPKPYKISR